MNTTGYNQVERHWPAVLAALNAASGPTAGDAFRATCRLRWLPLSLPDPIDEVHAAAFKSALGLGRPLSSWLLLNPGAAARPLEALVPSDAVLERLDTEGWLHGAHQVCAAPPGRIREAWHALVADGVGPRSLWEDADRATDVVSGLWAILGVARQLILLGRTDEARGWSPVSDPDPGWPVVLHLLQKRGPGALVREVPRFEPEWALHVYASPPPAVQDAVAGARRALDSERPFAALDLVWAELSEP